MAKKRTTGKKSNIELRKAKRKKTTQQPQSPDPKKG